MRAVRCGLSISVRSHGFESRRLVFGLDVAEWLKAVDRLVLIPCHSFRPHFNNRIVLRAVRCGLSPYMRVGVQTPRGFESRRLVFGLDVAEWLKALWGLPHFPCHLFARNLSSEK